MQDYLEVPLTEEPNFRDAVDALSLGMSFRIHLSPDGRRARFLHIGAGCKALTGIPAAAMLANAQLLADLILPEDRERLTAAMAAAAAEQRACSAEIRVRRPDGEVQWRRVTASPHRLPDGSTVWDGLQTDITESRRLAEQLAEERRRLQLAVDVTGIGVFRWDRADPDRVTWSDRQYEICGMPPETSTDVGRYLSLAHPDDVALIQDASRAARHAPDGGDYSVEHRIVRPDGEVRWVLLHGRVTRDEQGVRTIDGTTLDVTERRGAEEQQRLQMRELAHRGKNSISVMMAMVHQAARSAGNIEQLSEVLMARLQAMARSQDLAMASGGRAVPLAQLLDAVLAPFDRARFEMAQELAALTVSGGVATSLALLLHEMATNAVKYGALSNATGRIAVRCHMATEALAALEWIEAGGPGGCAPGRRGFGSRLLETALKDRGGRVQARFAPEGFSARVEFPATG